MGCQNIMQETWGNPCSDQRVQQGPGDSWAYYVMPREVEHSFLRGPQAINGFTTPMDTIAIMT